MFWLLTGFYNENLPGFHVDMHAAARAADAMNQPDVMNRAHVLVCAPSLAEATEIMRGYGFVHATGRPAVAQDGMVEGDFQEFGYMEDVDHLVDF